MPHYRIRLHRLHRDLFQVTLDALALDQLPVGDLFARRRGIRHHPSLHLQPICRHSEPLRRQLQQHRARLRSRRAQRRAQYRDVHRSEGAHVIRAEIGIAEHHIHRAVSHIQLFRQNLRQHGAAALAQLDLAGEAGDTPVGADAQVGIEVGRPGLPRGQPPRLLLVGTHPLHSEENEQPRTRQGEKSTATDVHHAPPMAAPAAS